MIPNLNTADEISKLLVFIRTAIEHCGASFSVGDRLPSPGGLHESNVMQVRLTTPREPYSRITNVSEIPAFEREVCKDTNLGYRLE